MSTQLHRRKSHFHTSIRKQSLNRLLGLKRIKPKLIQSDQQALVILVDGLDILKHSQNDQQLIQALKSMTQSFKKYDHSIHEKLIRQIVENVKWLVTDPMRIDVIKQEGVDLLTIMCFNCTEMISFSDLRLQVLQGYNLKSIRLTLIAMCQLLMNLKDLSVSIFRQLILSTSILKRLNILLSNYNNTNGQCFQFIKTPFIAFSTYLCYICYHWKINCGESDFIQLLECCVVGLERDVVKEGERDHTLKVYFERIYAKESDDNCYYEFHAVAYPFGLLGLITKMISEVNVDVLQTLSRCLDFQIQNNTVEKPLVSCLITIFKQTTTILDEQLRDKLFRYIFQMKYTQKENQGCVKEIILLVVNNSVNQQAVTESLFKAMGDKEHKRYPQTCHLLELMEYLEEREDFVTQGLLMTLVQNYITFNGSYKYIEECQKELMNFQEGFKMLERLGLVKRQIQEDDEYGEEIFEI